MDQQPRPATELTAEDSDRLLLVACRCVDQLEWPWLTPADLGRLRFLLMQYVPDPTGDRMVRRDDSTCPTD